MFAHTWMLIMIFLSFCHRISGDYLPISAWACSAHPGRHLSIAKSSQNERTSCHPQIACFKSPFRPDLVCMTFPRPSHHFTCLACCYFRPLMTGICMHPQSGVFESFPSLFSCLPSRKCFIAPSGVPGLLPDGLSASSGKIKIHPSRRMPPSWAKKAHPRRIRTG